MTTPDNPHTPDPEAPRSAEAVERHLEQILLDTEAALKELRAELALQRDYRAQHAAVERLPEYLAATSSRWENVRTFFAELIKELRTGREAATPEAKSHD